MKELLQETRDALRSNYLADDRPWVVAFSGGKDSTLVLQLVYELLLELGDKAVKPVHIVCSDTRVEPPNIADYIHTSLQQLKIHAKQCRFPLFVHIVQPTPKESFWFNVIGKGYPTPTSSFRWCTTKMKIKPSRRVIDRIVKEHGGVIILIGVRKSESSNRAKTIQAREYTSRGLHSHEDIPDALIMSPIAYWDTDSVWDYLFTNNPAPWGIDHKFMLNLYRQASGGECPVALDLNTQSCGNSRFGCWTCTVVREDKSMKGFIDSGATELTPLYDFRNRLRNDIRPNPSMRMNQRRDGSPAPGGKGPFTPEARQKILAELLQLEVDTKQRLINDDELAHIQLQWAEDFDTRGTLVFELAKKYGRNIKQLEGDLMEIQRDKRDELLLELAAEHEINEQWVYELMNLVVQKYPPSNLLGNKKALVRDVQKVIEHAVTAAEAAEQ
ncbi:DNA phosphorothioation system sulfurtransferase DndC [Candidatus Electrothrix sp.]|uniref:DNA phosphorothioation system sulfurtransferase DndC n=1 Tax=Candidatus Electrothrix sp. TaxID=2170559 RepID=UPI004056518D